MEGLHRKGAISCKKQEINEIMYNEKSRKNLKPFSSKRQPKRNGRPKSPLSLTNEIRKIIESIDPASKKLIGKLLAIAVTKQAMNGNLAYFREIIERLDGKVADKTEHTGKDGGPITLKVVYDD